MNHQYVDGGGKFGVRQNVSQLLLNNVLQNHRGKLHFVVRKDRGLQMDFFLCRLGFLRFDSYCLRCFFHHCVHHWVCKIRRIVLDMLLIRNFLTVSANRWFCYRLYRLNLLRLLLRISARQTDFDILQRAFNFLLYLLRISSGTDIA